MLKRLHHSGGHSSVEKERGRKRRPGRAVGSVPSPMPGTGNDLTSILKRHACILSPREIPGQGYKGKLVQLEHSTLSGKGWMKAKSILSFGAGLTLMDHIQPAKPDCPHASYFSLRSLSLRARFWDTWCFCSKTQGPRLLSAHYVLDTWPRSFWLSLTPGP